jgi:hypothetical protein
VELSNKKLIIFILFIINSNKITCQKESCLYLRIIYPNWNSQEISLTNPRIQYNHIFRLDSTNRRFLSLLSVSETICLPISRTRFTVSYNGYKRSFKWRKRNVNLCLYLSDDRRIIIRRFKKRQLYI